MLLVERWGHSGGEKRRRRRRMRRKGRRENTMMRVLVLVVRLKKKRRPTLNDSVMLMRVLVLWSHESLIRCRFLSTFAGLILFRHRERRGAQRYSDWRRRRLNWRVQRDLSWRRRSLSIARPFHAASLVC